MTVSNHARIAPPVPPKRVVVIGGGVAGMTAAHELAERGYEVEVVEKAADPYDGTARLGGMARTSWARTPQPSDQDPLTATGAPPPLTRLFADAIPVPVWLNVNPARHANEKPLIDEEDARKALNRLLDACKKHKPPLPVSVSACANKPDGTQGDELLIPAYKPEAHQKLCELVKKITVAEVPYDFKVLRVSDPASEGLVQVAAQSTRVPGEHGFRFFPSFYRHLFDTMKRIPVPEASLTGPILAGTVAQADSSRSVFDNLASSEFIQISLPPAAGSGVRTFDIKRQPLASLEDLRRLMSNTLERAGYRGQDLYRLVTRYLEYMVSSPGRRWKEYETTSWADFLELDTKHYSNYFISQVQSGAQGLVAMSSNKNDARTIGSIAVALTLDQVRAGAYSDGTLQDPTSTALFWPWQNYLESLGVTFTLGELVGFMGDGMAVRPAFCESGSRKWLPIDPADYYVITVPAPDLLALFKDGRPARSVSIKDRKDEKDKPLTLLTKQQLLEANRLCLRLDVLEDKKRAPKVDKVDDEVKADDDLGRYLNADQWLNDPTKDPDAGPLRYMTGIQFYFAANVKIVNGHALCLDSPWGVSYLSQVQYWQDRQRGENGVRGVISAIFTKWTVEAPGPELDPAQKTALDCTPQEIADRVWKQIADAWDVERNGPLPTPLYFYIDENMTYDDKTRRWTNATPYLVNDLGTWEKRPGRRTGSASYEYRLQLGHTVFAGAFMRTATRLNTMEAANESARRAVNAILARDQKTAGTPVSACTLWSLEDYELPDFRQLRDLDRRIMARGGRNIVRSGLIEASLRATPWDLVRLGLPTYPDPEVDQ